MHENYHKEEVEYEIKPNSNFSLGFRELWEYRELLFFFTWRDIKVKYKQAFLGILWVIIQPLLLMLVFTFILYQGLSLETEGMPYPVFALSGLIIWNIFSGSLSNTAESMITHANIIKKIYFPRMVIPLSAILTALFDFLSPFMVYLVLIIWYQIQIQWTCFFLFLPLGILICCIASFGLGTLLGALNVKYRDFRYIIPFLIQFLFFLSPIIYSNDTLKVDWLRYFILFNPITASLELFRSPFLAEGINWASVGGGTIAALVLLIAGVYIFRKTERFFSDLV